MEYKAVINNETLWKLAIKNQSQLVEVGIRWLFACVYTTADKFVQETLSWFIPKGEWWILAINSWEFLITNQEYRKILSDYSR